MVKLYIIGNGFDKAHKLLTGYDNFKKWLGNEYPTVEQNFSKLLEKFISSEAKKVNDLWCSLEESLTKFDNSFFEEAAGDYYNEDLTEYENVSLQELEQVIRVFNQLKWAFSKWVNSIKINPARIPYNLSPDDYYMTFNYTSTLETIYGIPQKAIFHVHELQNSDIIMGHNNNYHSAFNHTGILPNGDVELMHGIAEDNYKIQELRYVVQQVQELLYKPIEEKLIPALDKWLVDKDNPAEIIVLGHSYGMVDSKYFRFLKEKYPDSSWTYNVYDQETEDRLYSLLEAQRKNKQSEDENSGRNKA